MYAEFQRRLHELGIESDNTNRIMDAFEAQPILRSEIAKYTAIDLLKASEDRSSPFAGDGFRLAIEASSLSRGWKTTSRTAIKKLVSMSTTTFVRCGHIEGWRSVHGSKMEWRGSLADFIRLQTDYRALVDANLIVPVTTVRMEWIGEWPDGEAQVTHVDTLSADELPIDLSCEALRRQFHEERAITSPIPTCSVNLFLPHLESVDVSTIVDLRRQETDSFIQYHRLLRRFMTQSAEAENETAIYDAMREVDEGVRQTDETFRSIQKKDRYRATAIGLGLTTVALCMFAPREVSEFVGALLGGATGGAVFEYLASRTEDRARIRESEFYFPWRLSRCGKRGMREDGG